MISSGNISTSNRNDSGLSRKRTVSAAGRMVKEGGKSYTYGYLDKVLAVRENDKKIASFDYQVDGQIAQAIHGDQSEAFFWDGLALIHRGETSFINEPYVTDGNPILSSKQGVMFNDMLGNTLGTKQEKFNPVQMTAFGETKDSDALFTGKPYIGELGYAFLFRNYRADQGKWQTTDPLGYPDGWNNLAYGNNQITDGFDYLGTAWTTTDMYEYYKNNDGSSITLQQMGLKDSVFNVLNSAYNENWENGGEWFNGVYLLYSLGAGQNPTGYMDRMKSQITALGEGKINKTVKTGQASFSYDIARGYNFSPLVWAMGGGDIRVTMSKYTVIWEARSDGYIYYSISGTYNLHFSDTFSEPIDIPGFEWGTIYSYYDIWKNLTINLNGKILE